MAYVAQQAFVQQGTIRDNVCFGKQFNRQNFIEVVKACALDDDLKKLPGGMLTQLGGKVITKTRINHSLYLCNAKLVTNDRNLL